MESHEILNGKARLYQRPDSDLWYASIYWQSKNHRKSTGEKDFDRATAFAEDWYWTLTGKTKPAPRTPQTAVNESGTHKILNGKVQLLRCIGYTERKVGNIASGDVFVTTWQSVAATRKETRKIRQSGDISIALDEFIPSLRELDFRIGVVVDEAHHGFTGATEAVKVSL